MKYTEGQIKTTKHVYKRRECEECSVPATHCLTYLYENARRNPKSRGYGGDDISWSFDEERYACDEHKEEIRNDPPRDMEWNSDFYAYRDGKETGNIHRVFYWDKIEEVIN